MNDKWFAILMIMLIFSVTIGAVLWGNCIALDEICKK